jgi:hypothetical protein
MAEQEPRDDAADRTAGGRTGGRPPRARDAASGRSGPSRPRDAGSSGSRDDRGRSDRKPYEKRDSDRKPYAKHDGDKKPYVKRDGDRKPYASRDGDRKPYEKRDGGRGPQRSDRPTRGGADRPDRATRPEEIRPVRSRHDDPVIPEEVTPQDLHPSARNELKTLSKENAEQVARHLVMASELIDDDPELAHQHAISASRRAGRIAIVRETLAITAYATGDYALALRELRTYRRISGKDDQIALMVDSERGVGRPDRALEVGRGVDRAALPTEVRVGLAIAMSGARLDLGEPERALQELEIPELDPDRAFEWSPALFAARATVLEELGRTDEALRWQERAQVAAEAIDAALGAGDLETVFVDEIIEIDDEVTEPGTAEEAAEGVDPDATADEPEAATADELESDAVAAAADEPDTAADAGEEASAFPSVEDEVAEILAEAGVDDVDDADDDDADAPEGNTGSPDDTPDTDTRDGEGADR